MADVTGQHIVPGNPLAVVGIASLEGAGSDPKAQVEEEEGDECAEGEPADQQTLPQLSLALGKGSGWRWRGGRVVGWQWWCGWVWGRYL